MTTATLQPDSSTALDTYIREGAATTNHASSNQLSVNRQASSDTRSTLLKFDLSSIPSGATVTAATLTLTTKDADTSINLLGYRLLSSYVVGQATWNIRATATNWNTAGALGVGTDYNSTLLIDAAIPAAIDTAMAIDVATTVQNWVDGTWTNHGWLMWGSDPGSTILRDFHSSRATTSTYRPKLVVEYNINQEITQGEGLTATAALGDQLTNYVKNGSFEIGTGSSLGNWSQLGTLTTLERSTSNVLYGDYSAHLVFSSVLSDAIYQDATGMADGDTMTISLDVYVVAGNIYLYAFDGGGFSNWASDFSSGTGWQTLTVSHAATAGGVRVALSGSASGAECYVDGVICSTTAADFFDGDTSGAIWNGTPDASTSTLYMVFELGQTIAASSLTVTPAIGAPTITPGPVAITAESLTATAAIGTPTITIYIVQDDGLTATAAIGEPAVVQIITPNSLTVTPYVSDLWLIPATWPITDTGDLTATAAIGEATIMVGGVVIAPTGLTATAAIGAPTIVPGGIALTGVGGLTRSPQIGLPTIIPPPAFITGVGDLTATAAIGAVTLTPVVTIPAVGGLTATAAIGAPTLTVGVATIAPTSLTSSPVLSAITVTRGGVTIAPASLTESAALGAPALSVGTVALSGVGGLTASAALGTISVGRGVAIVAPDALTASAAIGAPTLTTRGPAIAPASLTASAAIGQPTLTVGLAVVAPPSLTASAAIGAATIGRGAVVLSVVGDLTASAAIGQFTLLPGVAHLLLVSMLVSAAIGQPTVSTTGGGQAGGVQGAGGGGSVTRAGGDGVVGRGDNAGQVRGSSLRGTITRPNRTGNV